mgnify:CR=1 FL=1
MSESWGPLLVAAARRDLADMGRWTRAEWITAVTFVVMVAGWVAADSLGLYLTLLPEDGATCSDADRNCISNVHPPHGLDYATAAARASWLVREALARGYSGVALKDESPRERPALTRE